MSIFATLLTQLGYKIIERKTKAVVGNKIFLKKVSKVNKKLIF
jgi:hypothetical protein